MDTETLKTFNADYETINTAILDMNIFKKMRQIYNLKIYLPRAKR